MIPLVLLGAGGFARETVEVVHAINEKQPTYELLGFLDDDPGKTDAVIDGIRVLGQTSLIAELAGACAVACVGSPDDYSSRRRLTQRLDLPPDRWATLVHPTAVVPRSAVIGPGTVVQAAVVMTTSVRIGSHVVFMPGVVITHDGVVGDYVTFGSGAMLAGGVVVGEGAYIGAGALIRERRRVGEWSLLGMGSVLTDDVPAGEVWAGVPARKLRAAVVPVDVAPAPDPEGDVSRA